MADNYSRVLDAESNRALVHTADICRCCDKPYDRDVAVRAQLSELYTLRLSLHYDMPYNRWQHIRHSRHMCRYTSTFTNTFPNGLASRGRSLVGHNRFAILRRQVAHEREMAVW